MQSLRMCYGWCAFKGLVPLWMLDDMRNELGVFDDYPDFRSRTQQLMIFLFHFVVVLHNRLHTE